MNELKLAAALLGAVWVCQGAAFLIGYLVYSRGAGSVEKRLS